MMSELTERVDEPTVTEGDAEANRWQQYGKDRIYLNDNDFSGKYDAYIDLETGEFVCEYPSDFQIEIEDGTATITKHWSHQGEDYSEVVVVVDLFDDGESDDESDAGGEQNDVADATVEPEEPQAEYRLMRDQRDDLGRLVAVRQMRPPKGLEDTLSAECSGVERMMDGLIVHDLAAFVAAARGRDIQVVDARGRA